MIGIFRNRWLRNLSRTLIPGVLIAASLPAQQIVPVAAVDTSSTQDQIASLKAQLAEQQRQLEQLRGAMQKQQEMIERAAQRLENAEVRKPAASLGEVASIRPVLPMPAVVVPAVNPAGTLGAQSQAPGKAAESPLGFQIGAARFSPLGFMDFISVTRSTNTGNILATNFANIPYSSSPAGNLSETRLSAQNSRLGLRIDSEYKGFKILGYLETDFLGNAATSLFQTSNSDTLRMRLFFAEVTKGSFEIVAGQTWSLLTPNRVGISPLPSDIFYGQEVDTNYLVGLPWARQTGFRLGWHPNKNVAWAFAVENADQFTTASTVLPTKLATPYGGQIDAGGNSSATPTYTPDFITKLAFDGGAPGHAAHLELAGVLSTFRTYNPATSQYSKTVGGGGSINGVVELVPHLRLISTNYFNSGGGRYFQGNGPDFILKADGTLSTVHSGGTVDGLELQATRKFMLYGYYGAVYFGRNTGIDSDGKTIIGYGAPGAAGANRTIQEATFGLVNNFWKSPQYGALTLNLQYSYLTRNPWNVPTAGAPQSANTNMGYVDLRYTLP